LLQHHYKPKLIPWQHTNPYKFLQIKTLRQEKAFLDADALLNLYQLIVYDFQRLARVIVNFTHNMAQ